MSGFHGAYATGAASQQGTLTLPDTWFRPHLGLANAPIVETKFLELAMSLLDFSPRIPLGTFSIFLVYIIELHRAPHRRFLWQKKATTTKKEGKNMQSAEIVSDCTGYVPCTLPVQSSRRILYRFYAPHPVIGSPVSATRSCNGIS